MDGWNTIVSYWEGLFSGAILVSGRVPYEYKEVQLFKRIPHVSYQLSNSAEKHHESPKKFHLVPRTAGGTPPCCRAPGSPPGTGKLDRPGNQGRNFYTR